MQKFTGKMPDASDTTSIEHRALTDTVRTPSVWPHCLGKKSKALLKSRQITALGGFTMYGCGIMDQTRSTFWNMKISI